MYDRGHRAAVLIACAGAFVAFLDTTIVNIAFPDISASFAGSGRDALSWVLDGYFVVIAALLVPAGGLADRFGHRAVIVPGTIVFAAGVMVLRSSGAEPDWLGLWLPGSLLTGIGIGLAFPTLGSAAVRDVPVDRFATASAVNAAFRQVGAVLGTAILVAIVGEPASLAEALHVSDGAFLFAVIAALVAGAVTLTLRPLPRSAGGEDADAPEAPAAVAYETAST